jgi:hypothetical protein
VEHPYALFTCSDLVCETSSPIGRIVVYDQHVDVGRRREDTVRDGAEVVAFVIGRQHDEDATACRAQQPCFSKRHAGEHTRGGRQEAVTEAHAPA